MSSLLAQEMVQLLLPPNLILIYRKTIPKNLFTKGLTATNATQLKSTRIQGVMVCYTGQKRYLLKNRYLKAASSQFRLHAPIESCPMRLRSADREIMEYKLLGSGSKTMGIRPDVLALALGTTVSL